jgi:hypothetical protein
VNPWREVLGRIEEGAGNDLVEFLGKLGDLGRRAVGRQLPCHLAGRLGGGFEARWEVEDLASGYRLAGAACLGGAEQVAAWLNRRELRRVNAPETDAARIVSLIKDRPREWREDLAVRLVKRLRPPAGTRWQRVSGPPNWDLAAALVVETGVEPPESDAFVAGWAWRLAGRRRMGDAAALAEDRLLDHMLARLFQAQGVADALAWNERWNAARTIVGELVELSATGRVSRQALLDGCAGRFLAGGEAADTGPFVTMWRELAPDLAEIPVLDFVRLLPSAPSVVVQLAVEELRHADAAGALDGELFTEAVQALAFRPEEKHITSAVKWIADAPPARGGGAVGALSTVFDVDTPALRERAVRLAVKLALHAAEGDRDAVREAATRLPADLRDRVAASYGPVSGIRPEAVAGRALKAVPLPPLTPPIASAAELAAELDAVRWPDEPAQFERALAALVELTHRDRDGVVEALRPWWRKHWQQPFDAGRYAFMSGFDDSARGLLDRCALAVMSPADSRELTALLAAEGRDYAFFHPAPQRFVHQRFREIITLFEGGETMPVLLATPTAPTGHVDAETLIGRLERLGAREPLEADFAQALLRLPRHVDPALITRAEKLLSQAGRRLAAWLSEGGLPDPAVTWGVEAVERHGYGGPPRKEAHARVAPPAGLPKRLRELCTVQPKRGHPYPNHLMWWPAIMPSHREVVAAHLLECLPWRIRSSDGQVEVVAALAHGDGPVGPATAGVIAVGLGHRIPDQRAAAADALVTLAVHGTLPALELGRAVADLVRANLLKLGRIAEALDGLILAGAHAEVWSILAVALPLLLPAAGERPRAGLSELLRIAAQAADLAAARADIPRLAEMAARKGSSLLLHEARRLHELISA